ncbi:hypothetical protein C5Z26_05140 [Lactobacillus sp. CBA3606]|uniref:hypothetical protein n=1 Tax=Lactobacillus sp. CBA3606 TaxID=2099789 RepID=UPI000CFD5B39|nr:hypothetical protein [Lactobacillus sp. CBA3606]AVK63525.1 hypothetical protein C5Z26_05140 [Lactobacillus sp. CBA3606]
MTDQVIELLPRGADAARVVAAVNRTGRQTYLLAQRQLLTLKLQQLTEPTQASCLRQALQRELAGLNQQLGLVG